MGGYISWYPCNSKPFSSSLQPWTLFCTRSFIKEEGQVLMREKLHAYLPFAMKALRTLLLNVVPVRRSVLRDSSSWSLIWTRSILYQEISKVAILVWLILVDANAGKTGILRQFDFEVSPPPFFSPHPPPWTGIVQVGLLWVQRLGSGSGRGSFPFFSPTFRLVHVSVQPCIHNVPGVNSWSVKLIIYC